MTPRELYQYAIKKGLADTEVVINRKDGTFVPLNKESVGVIEFISGPRVVIREA